MGVLDSQQSGFDRGLPESQIYVSRLSADGSLLSYATLPVCQDSRTKAKVIWQTTFGLPES